MQEAPAPIYRSTRHVGLELEYDSGSMTFQDPGHIEGWSQKTDGSLSNGYEYVLEPCVEYNSVAPCIQRFTDRFDGLKFGLTKRGGFHVHVRVADYTHQDAYRLVSLYTRFQRIINELVAKSRVNNRYCLPFTESLTEEALIEEFELNTLADNRRCAKGSRTYRTVNCAMMRCRDPQERTVEFRQGSVSKRFSNIFGWTTLCVVLTDMAKDAEFISSLPSGNSLENFLAMIRSWEERTGATNVSAWVEWRHHIMNQAPAAADLERALLFVQTGPKGLVPIATYLDVNYPMVQRIMEILCQNGSVVNTGGRYRSTLQSEGAATEDLNRLHEAENQRRPQIAA